MSEETVTTAPVEPAPAESKPETVLKAEYDALANKIKAQESQLAKMKDEKRQRDDAELKQRNEWQKLAELKEQEAATARQEADRIKSSYLNERKFSTVREAALKAGLRPEAVSDLELVDLADVTIETTSTGKINVLGSDKFAERLKALRPHWFLDKPPVVNTVGVRPLEPSGPVTPDQIYAAEKEGRKSGDMTKYQELMKKYNELKKSARSTAH